MNKRKLTLLFTALGLMAVGAGLLTTLHARQKLGPPGVKTSPTADAHRLKVELPERVLDYESEELPVDKMVLDFLPQDTSFGQKIYKAPDGFEVRASVVLMGADRTSLHKPEFCLNGFGWKSDPASTSEERVSVERPAHYQLPVMKMVTTKTVTDNGQTMQARGIYVYWFVAENAYTAKHWERMWWMARDLVRTGVLQRWAYISYFAVCPPGQEDATYQRVKSLIAASVPEFQLTPGATTATAAMLKSQ